MEPGYASLYANVLRHTEDGNTRFSLFPCPDRAAQPWYQRRPTLTTFALFFAVAMNACFSYRNIGSGRCRTH
jgi:hypothetical protein